MKKSIKLSALFLLFSTGLFAATPVKKAHKMFNADIHQAISVRGLSSTIGVSVNVAEQLNRKPFITISDMDGHELVADNLSRNIGSGRVYNLSTLDNGDYFITVSAGKQEIKKQVHIYEEYGKKTYFIMQ